MPFPPENSDWPLSQDAARYDRIAERSVWYAGDPDNLKAFYAGSVPGGGVRSWFSRGGGSGLHLHSGASRVQSEAQNSKFWGTPQSGPQDEKVHLPVPEKIAHMSAEALFSDPPRFVVEGPTTTDPVTKKVMPTPETERTQERLDALVDQTGLLATLLSAAETASALGSVALRLAWNPEVAKHPVISRADADAYFPFYDWGVLTAVLFWRVVYSDASQVWRHLELHEGGYIYHALYKGTPVSLGRLAPLADSPATAGLKVNEFGATFARPGLTTAVNVPNMLPDPMDRLNNAGRSDFTPSCIGLFSAIDQTASSLLRDVEDGQSRLLVADYMLRNAGFGKGATYDPTERMFVSLKRQPGDMGQEAPIDQVQFDIRYQEHLAIIEDLTSKAIEAAGFTPDSEQGGDAPDMTATEYVGRNKRTLATRDKKVLYWRAALEPLLTSLLVIDREVFGSQITPMPVKVVFPDAVQESPKVLAETAAAQKNADASSRRTRIKTMHPDWDEADVDAELKAIEDEGVQDVDTFGLPPAPAPGAASSQKPPAEDEAA